MGYGGSNRMFDNTRRGCDCKEVPVKKGTLHGMFSQINSFVNGKEDREIETRRECICDSKDKGVFMRKFEWTSYLVNHAESAGIGKDDLVMFVDGFDVVAQNPIEGVKAAYETLLGGKRGIVFSGEKNCFPFDAWDKGGWGWFHGKDVCVHQRVGGRGPQIVDGKFLCALMTCDAPTKGPYKWLNSGGYVGDVTSLKAFFEASNILSKYYNINDDQAIAQLVQLTFPSLNIVTDSSAEIWFAFQNFKDGDVDRIEEKPSKKCREDYLEHGIEAPVNKLTGTKPMFLHFNGNGKPFQGSCSTNILKYYRNKEHYFIDFDRGAKIQLKDICVDWR